MKNSEPEKQRQPKAEKQELKSICVGIGRVIWVSPEEHARLLNQIELEELGL